MEDFLKQARDIIESKGYGDVYVSAEIDLHSSGNVAYSFYNAATESHSYSQPDETLSAFSDRVLHDMRNMKSKGDAEVAKAVNKLEEARDILKDQDQDEFADSIGLAIKSIHTNLLTKQETQND